MNEVLQVESSLLKHPGLKKSKNQDWVESFEPGDPAILVQKGCVYVLADGVGGAAEGERASQYAAQKIVHEYYQHPEEDPGERLRLAMRQAGNDIYQYSEDQYQRMATTAVAAVIFNDRLYVANVGDSRAYLIRNGQARQITRDHNTVGELLHHGQISAEEARYAKKNRLTRSLGGDPNPRADVFEEPLQPGDRLLLCSDGLSRYTEDADIARLAFSGPPEEVVSQAVDFANRNGGVDNISVIAVEIKGYTTPERAVFARSSDLPASPEDITETVASRPVRPVPPSATRTPADNWRSLLEPRTLAIIGVAAAVVLLLGVAGLVFVWMSGFFGSAATETPAAMETTPTEFAAALPSETQSPATTPNPYLLPDTPTVIAGEPMTPTLTPVFTATQTLTATFPTGTPTQTEPAPTTETLPAITNPPSVEVPIAQICAGEIQGTISSISALMTSLGQDPKPQTDLIYYANCSTLVDSTSQFVCNTQGIVKSPTYVVQPGWWIQIPDVLPENCTSIGGTLLIYEPPSR